ncbi:MAG: AI-2E family transporter [Candidatus Levybacteria bacterium]|nr:AI-2E family transporter [Candidatus Levybacteria bacterium]
MIYKLFSYIFHHQLLLVLFIISSGWLILQLRDILTAVFISYIIMASLLPVVRFFQKKGLPNILAVLIPYVGMLIILFMLIIPLVPFVISQVQMLLGNFPKYIDEAATTLGLGIDAKQIEKALASELGNIGKNAFAVTTAVFGGVFSTVTILIVGFYLLLYHGKLKQAISSFFPKKHRDDVIEVLGQVDDKLGAWLRGQLVLGIAIGLLTFIALSVLGLPFALPLAVLAGILEAIPTLGPTIAAVPAVIVALTVSPSLAILVVITYIVIQTLENNILVPKIMQRAVGLNPVVVIIGVMIGANLMGIVGALLSIPFLSFIIVLYKSLEKKFDDK